MQSPAIDSSCAGEDCLLRCVYSFVAAEQRTPEERRPTLMFFPLICVSENLLTC